MLDFQVLVPSENDNTPYLELVYNNASFAADHQAPTGCLDLHLTFSTCMAPYIHCMTRNFQ